MAIDGALNNNVNVWTTNVTVTAGLTYCYCFWVASLYPEPFDLGMMVNGVNEQTVTVNQSDPTWTQYCLFWTSTVTGTVPIAIRQMTGGDFRDFGLDDIVFGTNITANFTYSPDINCGRDISFFSQSTGPAPLTYSWNFGDLGSPGNTSTLQNPTHQFNGCGEYLVCLTVRRGTCIDSICQVILVEDNEPPNVTCPPKVTATAYNLPTCSVQVNGLSWLTATDNCGQPFVDYTVTGATSNFGQNDASGLTYNHGTSIVTYIAKDGCGNTKSCTVEVVVVCEIKCDPTCPENLVTNPSFENGQSGAPNALNQIGLCTDWHSSNNSSSVSGIGEWYSYSNPVFPGFSLAGGINTVQLPHCGSKYAGFYLQSCEGISTTLNSAIPQGCPYEVGFWWSPVVAPAAPTTFHAILSGSNCTVYATGGTCSHQCGGDQHVIVNITPGTHFPGVWYYHSVTLNNAYPNVQNITFAGTQGQAQVDNYIFIDDVCVRKLSEPCEVTAGIECFPSVNPTAYSATVSLGCGSTVTQVEWYFDGVGPNPVSSLPNSVVHPFPTTGFHQVCLVVTASNDGGHTICRDTFCKEVLITTAPPEKCDSLGVFWQKLHTPEDRCCYQLLVDNMIPNCFREIELDISPGTFAGAVFDPGWNVTGAGTSHVQLTPLSGGFIPVGFLAPFTFCDPGGSGTHVLNVNILSGLPPTVDTCDFVFEYECFESTVDSCCLDFENFCQAVENAVTITVDQVFCKATFNIGNLRNCDFIDYIKWGDNRIEFGPFMSGDMLMHNYSQNGTYVIEYLAVEVDPHTGLICFEKVIRDTFTLNCGDCSCEDITFTVQPISNNIDVCCYRLIVQNTSDSCFDKISIQVDAGLSILNPSLNFPGWTVVPTGPQSIDLFPPASFVPIGPYIPLTFCVTGGTVHNIVVFTNYTTPAASYECPTFFTFECDKMGDCPNNLVVNGNFEMGTPPGGDEGIGFATSWSGIWPAGGGISTGDFYNTVFPSANMAYGSLFDPLPASQGNYGAFWSKPHGTNQIWREGIMGSLTAPILPNTGCYELKAKIACITKPLLPYAGTVYPVINVYGAHTGVGNTYPGFGPNSGISSPAPVLLGSFTLGATCDENFQQFMFTINTAASSGLPLTAAGFDRIFFTRADGVFSSVVVAMDDICLLPAPCPVEECACKPGASIQLIYDNVTQSFGCGQGGLSPVLPCPTDPTVGITTDFGCVDASGNRCADQINWRLYGPNGALINHGSYPGNFPISLVLPSSNFTLNGSYTMKYSSLCSSQVDSCICVARWIFDCGCVPTPGDSTWTQEVDVVYVLDNSASVDPNEFSDMQTMVTNATAQIQAVYPNAQFALTHYSGPCGERLYIEQDFAPALGAIPRRFNALDDLNAALGNVLDALNGVSNPNIISPIQTLNQRPGSNLLVIIFTDGYPFVPAGSNCINSALQPYNNSILLKQTKNASITVVHLDPTVPGVDPVCAAIASPGGTYAGPVDNNGYDSGTSPRQYIPWDFSTLNLNIVPNLPPCEPDPDNCCDSLMVMPVLTTTNGRCCATLNLKNKVGYPVYKFEAELVNSTNWVFGASSLSFAAGYTWATPPTGQKICLGYAAGTFPTGNTNGALTFCLASTAGVPSATQTVVFRWYGVLPGTSDTVVVCTDTLRMNCGPTTGSGCVDLVSSNITCNPFNPYEYIMNFTVQNLSGSPMNQVVLQGLPPGYGFSMCSASSNIPAIALTLSPYPLPNGATSNNLCVKIISPFPILTPTQVCFRLGLVGDSTCCNSPTQECVVLQPCCDPCEGVFATSEALNNPDGACCYKLDLNRQCLYKMFSKVEIVSITPGVIFGWHALGGPDAANWFVFPGATPTNVSFGPNSGAITTNFVEDIIQFCLDGITSSTQVPQKVVVRWYTNLPPGERIVCTDTLIYDCQQEFDCVWVDSEIECLPDSNKYLLTMTVTNHSSIPFGATDFHVQVVSPGNLILTPTGGFFPLSPPLQTNSSTTITTCIESTGAFPPAATEIVLSYRLGWYNGVFLDTCCFESMKDTIKLPPCDPCDTVCVVNALNVSTGYDPGFNILVGPGAMTQMWNLISAPSTSSVTGPFPQPGHLVGNYPGWASPAGSSWLSPFPFNNGTSSDPDCPVFSCTACEPFVFERTFCLCDSSEVTFDFDFYADNAGEVELWNKTTNQFITTLASHCLNQGSSGNFMIPISVNTVMGLGANEYALRIKNWNQSGPVAANLNGFIYGAHLEKDSCCTDRSGCIVIRKFNDVDCDSTFALDPSFWNNNEPMLPGWTFTITHNTTSQSYTGTTNAQGEVLFCVPPGTYTIAETVQPGWSITNHPTGFMINSNNYGIQIAYFGNCDENVNTTGAVAIQYALRIRPNPNTGVFTATMAVPPASGDIFHITDLAGRRVYTQDWQAGVQEQTVRVEALPAGLYFLQWYNKEGQVLATEKFVKQ